MLLMNQFVRRTASLGAALVLAMTSAARAEFDTGPLGKCGGSNFSTCAAVELTWTGSTATLTVTNLGNADAIFTTIGLTNLPTGYSFNEAGSDLAGWNLPNGNGNLNGDGLVESTFEVDAKNPGPKNGLALNQSITFIFDFTGLTAEQAAAVGVGIHALSGPDGCSTKINFDGSGNITNSPSSYNGCGASTVPEPATIGLVTTGLLGLGGAGFLRRRKKV
jgi:hypothetical protein